MAVAVTWPARWLGIARWIRVDRMSTQICQGSDRASNRFGQRWPGINQRSQVVGLCAHLCAHIRITLIFPSERVASSPTRGAFHGLAKLLYNLVNTTAPRATAFGVALFLYGFAE